MIFRKKIEEHNSAKKQRIIIFDDMIANMLSNKKINLIVTELFIRDRIKTFLFYYSILFCSTKNIY